jgi:hypothetical protein
LAGSQNCNLELSHAHIRDEEGYDSPGGQFPADAANSVLGLWGRPPLQAPAHMATVFLQNSKRHAGVTYRTNV